MPSIIGDILVADKRVFSSYKCKT